MKALLKRLEDASTWLLEEVDTLEVADRDRLHQPLQAVTSTIGLMGLKQGEAEKARDVRDLALAKACDRMNRLLPADHRCKDFIEEAEQHLQR